jgi:homoserine kinase type II
MTSLKLARKCAEGFGFEPTGIVALSGGRINENARVDHARGSRLLRLYPKGRSPSQIRFEMEVVQHLANQGCSVPRPITSASGSLLIEVESRIAVWMDYLPAEPLSNAAAYTLPASSLGDLLHPVFRSLETFRAPFSKTTETRIFKRRLIALFSLLESEKPNLTEPVRDLYHRLSVWESSLDLPSSALHADIHPKNVLQQSDGTLWLIDFDDGHVGHRVTDWVLPAIEFSIDERGELDEARYQELLKSLVPARAIPEEKRAIPRYRTLLALKFAVALADLGEPLENNPYLALLKREDFSLPD